MNGRNIPWPLIISISAYYLFLRPQMKKWGTSLGESQRRLPGDELIPQPNFQMTHAINIDAPPQAVWPWIAQMGRERTGYYGLDLLTNQGIPSVTFLRQDIPGLQVDMEMDGGYRILECEQNRKLLFGNFNLRRPFGATQDLTALYLLEGRPDGSARLIARQRAFSYGLTGAIYNHVFEVLSFVATIQQLNQLKRHAESMAHL